MTDISQQGFLHQMGFLIFMSFMMALIFVAIFEGASYLSHNNPIAMSAAIWVGGILVYCLMGMMLYQMQPSKAFAVFWVILGFAILVVVVATLVSNSNVGSKAGAIAFGVALFIAIVYYVRKRKSRGGGKLTIKLSRDSRGRKLTIKRARETKYGDLVLDFGEIKLFKVAGVEYPTTASGNLTIRLDSTILNEAGVTDKDTIDLAYNKLMSFLVTHEIKQDTKGINEDPTQALRLRLAKGEITKEEYEELRKIVEP